MAAVVLETIAKRYRSVAAIDDVSISVASGEFLTLLGPSGCGKTTTLRAIAGLVQPDRGMIRIADKDVTAIPTYRRNIGMVFQSHAIFPHMTVAENVAFGLKMRGLGRGEQMQRTSNALEMVRLGGYQDRYPHQLSGGQQQRVALARALVINPDVLLLDEPFGALDRKLREAMQIELRQLTRQIGITAVFVTHDQEEALMLSDRIAVMSAGRVIQVARPAEVFERPASQFVADFMGVSNFIDGIAGTTRDGTLAADCQGLSLRASGLSTPSPGSPITVGVRAEHARLSVTEPAGSRNRAIGTVETVIYHGAAISVTLRLDAAPSTLFTVRGPAEGDLEAGCAPGDRLWVAWPAAQTMVFPRA